MTAQPPLTAAGPALILGMGVSGLAMARWCARHGPGPEAGIRGQDGRQATDPQASLAAPAAQHQDQNTSPTAGPGPTPTPTVVVVDTRELAPMAQELKALCDECPSVVLVHSPLTPELLGQPGSPFAAIYRSPGLAPALLLPLTQEARARGIAVLGELDVFCQALSQLKAATGYNPCVLAITGTNGKTTVTALTGRLVAAGGRSVQVAGNIGPSLLEVLERALGQDNLPEVWVLELSSFQLEAASGFEPTAACCLNLTQDHLDWHGSMAAYAQSKAKIFGRQAFMVLNRQDPLVWQMRLPAQQDTTAQASSPDPASNPKAGRPSSASKGRKSAKTRLPVLPKERACVSFGANAPSRPGDYGFDEDAGILWLARALTPEETGEGLPRQGAGTELHIQRLMPVEALQIRGRHNALNALAALALAERAGCALAPMLFALKNYQGEPHRVESVTVIDAVEYFDDSKGTNVGATAAALEGLGADRPIVVILGGEGKGQDFSPLAPLIEKYARAVVLIGRDARVIEAAIKTPISAASGSCVDSCGDSPHPQGGLAQPLAVVHAASMQEAVEAARAQARAGDAVLLSPACASFDMFTDYAHRAAVFRECVARVQGTQLAAAPSSGEAA